MCFSTRLDDWLSLIRGEFEEVPDLRVTLQQATLQWNLELRDLEVIMETFVDVGFLRRTSDGSYFHPRPRGVTTGTARSGKGLDRRQDKAAPTPLIQHT